MSPVIVMVTKPPRAAGVGPATVVVTLLAPAAITPSTSVKVKLLPAPLSKTPPNRGSPSYTLMVCV